MASRRMPPTARWWLALAVASVLLVGVGRALHASTASASWTTPPAVAVSRVAASPSSSQVSTMSDLPAPFSLLRSGATLTVTARVPDAAAEEALLAAVRHAVGSEVTVRDQVSVAAGSGPSDPPAVAALAGLGVGDFAYDFDGTMLTLMGTAPTETARQRVGSMARRELPAAQISNQLQVYAGPAASGSGCARLGPRVAAVMKRSPIRFQTDRADLDRTAHRTLAEVADLVSACPSARLLVTGHADSTGTDAINDPLSRARASHVASRLVADGLDPAQVWTKGMGSHDPVASNATREGRAQNRRAEVMVR